MHRHTKTHSQLEPNKIKTKTKNKHETNIDKWIFMRTGWILYAEKKL